nr:hypothetical protein Iba_chr01dCG4760 [Ipomoea batatas]
MLAVTRARNGRGNDGDSSYCSHHVAAESSPVLPETGGGGHGRCQIFGQNSLLGTYGTKGWPHPRRDIKHTTDRAPRMVEIRNKQWHLDETGRNLDTVPRNGVGRPNGIFVLDKIRVGFPDPSRKPTTADWAPVGSRQPFSSRRVIMFYLLQLLGLGSFGGVVWSWLIHLTACFSCLVLVALEVLDNTLDSFEELRNVLMVK